MVEGCDAFACTFTDKKLYTGRRAGMQVPTHFVHVYAIHMWTNRVTVSEIEGHLHIPAGKSLISLQYGEGFKHSPLALAEASSHVLR